MKTFQPADHLRSRTFIGLLIAQFLAAFNDQAIHAAAMFYAFNTQTLTESQAITWMPIIFYAPWAIFCTIAGYLADKYSKRTALVTWKVVEVGITILALFGFWLGRQEGFGNLGTWVVLSTVFLMGTHSAFFVPAKYGVMPEILTPRMLSRGNGVLESLSFLAIILGTVAGGVLSTVYRGQEYMIGVVLTVLALLGALASFFIERMPAANPERTFPPYIYGPLFKNIKQLLTSRPLVFAVVGIAFFTFLVAYMRQVVYMHGQSQQPPWSEAYTSIIVGMVALGIGIGSPLAGWLSGGKVEVGLVPLGAVGMVLATTVAAFGLFNVPVLIGCIIAIGFFTGFYLVPLYTLLQHRAPKISKGDSIATSNFINITGALAATAVFSTLHGTAIRSGFAPALKETAPEIVGVFKEKEYRHGHPHRVVLEVGEGEAARPRVFKATDEPDWIRKFFKRGEVRTEEPPVKAGKKEPYRIILIDKDVRDGETVVMRTYELNKVVYESLQPIEEAPNSLYNKEKVPQLLFLGTGAMTFLTLLLLWYFLPDLFRRTWLWYRSQGRYRMELAGMLRLPGHGPAVIVTDAGSAEALDQVERAADRVFRPVSDNGDMARSASDARDILRRGGVLGLTLLPAAGSEDQLPAEVLKADTFAPVLPVHHAEVIRGSQRYVYVIAGNLLPPGSSVQSVREELKRIGENLLRQLDTGEALEKEAADH